MQSKLSSAFSPYFIKHDVHLINRRPTPLLQNLTLFEKVYNKAPKYSDLKNFGCLAFVSTLLQNRGKFDDRSEKGIFIG